MALFDTTRPMAQGHLLGGRVSKSVAALISTIAQWNDARVTRNALGRLSDLELDDIGLSRGDIDLIANGALRT
jgi:uncharacterized protein YjiS (DUF1127 family)